MLVRRCHTMARLSPSTALVCSTQQPESRDTIHTSPITTARRFAGKRSGFIEDDDDVFRFRNAEASNVRRTHSGVPLGSSQVEREERKAAQQQLVQEDKMTDWKTFYIIATIVTLLYTLLQWIVDTGEPYQPTEYVPYVPKQKLS